MESQSRMGLRLRPKVVAQKHFFLASPDAAPIGPTLELSGMCIVLGLLGVGLVSASTLTLPAQEMGDAMPQSIGVLGVGTIGSAVVRGLLGAPTGHLKVVPSFVLFDPTPAKAKALVAEFPRSNVSVATSDQEVLDRVKCVILALPGSVAEHVIISLKFHQQQVVSLVAAIKLPRLQQLLGPAVDAAIAVRACACACACVYDRVRPRATVRPCACDRAHVTVRMRP